MDKYIFEKLDHSTNRCKRFPLTPDGKFVVFSDLHLGSGNGNDDFIPNAGLFLDVLDDYRSKGYELILNGDIEELQRNSLSSIEKQWKSVYAMFDQFESLGRLKKTIGNHDSELLSMKSPPYADSLYDMFCLTYKGEQLYFYHGHQASLFFDKLNNFTGKFLKYFANPLNIKNFSVHLKNCYRFQTERRSYLFSKKKRIVSIIGHTHRPLFDSMSKIDFLQYKIESLLRNYINTTSEQQEVIRDEIVLYSNELKELKIKEKKFKYGLYNNDRMIVPCVFNSGTVIGKRGITGLEISSGSISLVHWFDLRKSSKYIEYHGSEAKQLAGTSIYKSILNQDRLDYIFARIHLLLDSFAPVEDSKQINNIPVFHPQV